MKKIGEIEEISKNTSFFIVFSLQNIYTVARNLFSDDDYFTDYAPAPADRRARDLDFDFPQLDESFETAAHQRRERDGGFHGASHRAGRGQQGIGGRRQGQGGRRSGRGQRLQESDFEEERQGRQTGEVGLALGVLNNPPREDGSYNFK